MSERSIDEEYKTEEAYLRLPENVRHAIDLSKKKSKHSEFYIKLNELTDKINVYTDIFYSNAPRFQRLY